MKCNLVSIYFDSYDLGTSKEMLNFHFSGKGQEIFSTLHFVYDFSRKMFFMLFSINWANIIVWLPLLLKILGNMLISIVFFPDCDVINFEINLIVLIEPFFYMDKKSRQKFKHLENEKRFLVKQKHFSSFLTGLSAAKNCLRPESYHFKRNEQK